VKKSTAKADTAMLIMLAGLAARVGFQSPETTALRQYPISRTTRGIPSHRGLPLRQALTFQEMRGAVSRSVRSTGGPGVPIHQSSTR
jgi:hypothetical protein